VRPSPRLRTAAIAVVVAFVIVLVAIWQRSSDEAWLIVFIGVCLGALGMFVLQNASGRRPAEESDVEPGREL
jgi:peptidoglycan/LPS O-acetylase OafA/YrhL